MIKKMWTIDRAEYITRREALVVEMTVLRLRRILARCTVATQVVLCVMSINTINEATPCKLSRYDMGCSL